MRIGAILPGQCASESILNLFCRTLSGPLIFAVPLQKQRNIHFSAPPPCGTGALYPDVRKKKQKAHFMVKQKPPASRRVEPSPWPARFMCRKSLQLRKWRAVMIYGVFRIGAVRIVYTYDHARSSVKLSNDNEIRYLAYIVWKLHIHRYIFGAKTMGGESSDC